MKEVRLVQKGERNYHPVARLKSFRVRNPKCDLGQGFCKTEKINNLPKVIQLDMTELGVDTAQVYALPYHTILLPDRVSQEQLLL